MSERPAAMISPYLVFDGNCKEAMQFYASAMGGELELTTFGEAPMDAPPGAEDRVMHSTLANDALSFMAADSAPGMPFSAGNNVQLSVSGTDEAKLREAFDSLATGGSVTMPLEKQFWGDVFGMLTDKFGMHWMFNIGDGMSAEESE